MNVESTLIKATAVAAAVFSFVACSQVVGVDTSDATLAPATRTSEGDAVIAGCAPKTCAELGKSCGLQDDGCGQAIDCGGCNGACLGGVCNCQPKTCADAAAACGPTDDGCGGVLDCGRCPTSSESCGDNQCSCAPADCAAQNVECGSVSDSCGNTYRCPVECAGELPHCNAGHCSAEVCVPKTCAELGKNCGSVNDGCGGVIDCGSCPSGQCGAVTPNVCGCTPKTCAQLGRSCGPIDDGCGTIIQCGGCTSPASCNGAGQCACTPSASCPAGSQCGTINDGCGNVLSCGAGCGQPNDVCGADKMCHCTPYSCADTGCGSHPNGCGGIINCGTCGGGGGGGCFAAGSRVRMADGSLRAIETIRAGDEVISFDARGRAIIARVRTPKVHGPESSAEGFVVLPGGLRVTPNHPIEVVDSDGRQHRRVAGNLRPGDVLLEEDRAAPPRAMMSSVSGLHKLVIGRIDHLPGGEMTYDLELELGEGFVVEGLRIDLKEPQEPTEPLQ